MINLFLETTNSPWTLYILLGVMLIAMFFLPMFSQKKRQKQVKDMLSSIRVGNRIKTIGGFVGKVISVNESDDTLVIDIGSDKPVEVVIARLGIYMNMDAVSAGSNPAGDSANDKPEKPSI